MTASVVTVGAMNEYAETAKNLEFGQRVARARKARNMSRTELAFKSAVSESSIRSVENGWRMPRPETLQRIAEVLGTSVDALLTGKHFDIITITHELAAHMGAAGQTLERIRSEEAGLVSRMVQVPIVGVVPARLARWKAEGEGGYVSVPAEDLAGRSQEDVAAVRVHGSRLLGFAIRDGDVLVFATADAPVDGDLVVVRLSDDETCCRWCVDERAIVLRHDDETVAWRGDVAAARLKLEGVVLLLRRTKP